MIQNVKIHGRVKILFVKEEEEGGDII